MPGCSHSGSESHPGDNPPLCTDPCLRSCSSLRRSWPSAAADSGLAVSRWSDGGYTRAERTWSSGRRSSPWRIHERGLSRCGYSRYGDATSLRGALCGAQGSADQWLCICVGVEKERSTPVRGTFHGVVDSTERRSTVRGIRQRSIESRTVEGCRSGSGTMKWQGPTGSTRGTLRRSAPHG